MISNDKSDRVPSFHEMKNRWCKRHNEYKKAWRQRHLTGARNVAAPVKQTMKVKERRFGSLRPANITIHPPASVKSTIYELYKVIN